MSWKFWEKRITIEDMFPNKQTKDIAYRSIEAYIITPLGIERLNRENNPPLSYEGAQILQALKRGQCTIGELADVCNHLYGPSARRELEKLVELGLIKRNDVQRPIITKHK